MTKDEINRELSKLLLFEDVKNSSFLWELTNADEIDKSRKLDDHSHRQPCVVILLVFLFASSLMEILLNFLPFFISLIPDSPFTPTLHAFYHYLNLCADFVQFLLIYLILRLLKLPPPDPRQPPKNTTKVAFSSLITRILTYLNLYVPLYGNITTCSLT